MAQKRRGRPRLDAAPLERLTARIPVSLFDALCREALDRQITLGQVVRERLNIVRKNSELDTMGAR